MDTDAPVLTWMSSPPRRPAVTLTFDLHISNQVISRGLWIYHVSFIDRDCSSCSRDIMVNE